jgi:CubicO group peptidase (beta-lactamase class C family)
VFERYPRMQPFEKHLLWSVGKTIPSTLIAMLEDEGRIDVQEPVERYLGELASSDWHGTPVIDILDMASGMGGLESDDPGAYTDPATLFYGYESSLGMLRPVPHAQGSTYDYIAALPRLKPSGEVFEYTSVNTFVLGWIVERLEGRPYAEVVTERIWRKIGAESDAQIIVSKHGAAATHGGMSMRMRDLIRWGLLFTPSWPVVTREPLISERYLAKIQTGGDPDRFRRKLSAERIASTPEVDLPRHNTYQWDAVMHDGDFFKAGFRGQGLYVSPSRDLVVAYAGTQDVESFAAVRTLVHSGLIGP